MSSSVCKIDLWREFACDTHIMGKLLLNGIYICDTLEPPYRNKFGAIPQGDYPIVLMRSLKFKRLLPVVCNVPNRSGIEFHAGNYPYDTRGCILTGYNDDFKKLMLSTRCLDVLMKNLTRFDNIKLEVYDMFASD